MYVIWYNFQETDHNLSVCVVLLQQYLRKEEEECIEKTNSTVSKYKNFY